MCSQSRLLQRRQKASIWGKGLNTHKIRLANKYNFLHHIKQICSVQILKQGKILIGINESILIRPFPLTDPSWPLWRRWIFAKFVTKGGIALTVKFLFLSHCFQLFSVIKVSLTENVHIFAMIFFKIVGCKFLECEKGLNRVEINMAKSCQL